MTAMQEDTALARRARLHEGPLEQYRRMVEIRVFEERVNELFAAGLILGTTHLCQGQEALDVGLALALEPQDVVCATYRSHGVALGLGLTPTEVMGEIMGRTVGCTGGVGGSMHMCNMDVGLLPTFAIVGAGLPVATGAALAFQTLGQPHVAVAVFGDGASNIGAFHESLNLASVWKLPVIFVLDNNVYGEYSRIDTTTPFEDLVRRADAYGMNAEVVDGMNVEAVRDAMARAAARARSGEGPTLIEAKTYRFAGHSRADTAPYRPEGELESWLPRDPLAVMERLLEEGGTTSEEIQAVRAQETARLDDLLGRLEHESTPDRSAMFRNIWG